MSRSDEANSLQGYAPATGSLANTVVARDSGGYIWSEYFNCTNRSIQSMQDFTSYFAFFSSDGFLRKASIESAQTALNCLLKSGGNLTGWLTFDTSLGIRINNQSQVTNLGTSSVVLCGNSGGFVRRYDNNNTPTVMHASQFAVESSRLVKENVKNITDDYARNILKLRPVSFDYIEKVGGQKGQCGMIAEEVLPIYPECVNVPDGYTEEKALKSIYEGNNTETLALDYAKFTPYLIKMVQMQQNQIDDMQKQIDELKDTIKTLTV